MSDTSVTRWLHELKKGDDSAARRLWQFLHRRILSVAAQELPVGGSASYDEEDVAQSAFHAFCRAIQQEKYPMIAGRDELWRLLAVVTVNKARDRARPCGVASTAREDAPSVRRRDRSVVVGAAGVRL